MITSALVFRDDVSLVESPSSGSPTRAVTNFPTSIGQTISALKRQRIGPVLVWVAARSIPPFGDRSNPRTTRYYDTIHAKADSIQCVSRDGQYGRNVVFFSVTDVSDFWVIIKVCIILCLTVFSSWLSLKQPKLVITNRKYVCYLLQIIIRKPFNSFDIFTFKLISQRESLV